VKLKIKSLDESDRPREKLLQKGRTALSNAELIAILLASGNREMNAVELAQHILSDYDNNLTLLGKLSVSDLKKYNGIGEAKAITIISALELARRRQASEAPKVIQIKQSKDAFDALYADLSDLVHEEFWILYLNKANRVIKKKRMTIGTTGYTLVDKKIVAKEALELLAAAVILAHNHPSGNLKPSKADLDLTKEIQKALQLFDIKVLDHIIIGNDEYISIADEGLM